MSDSTGAFAADRFQLGEKLGEGPSGVEWLGVDPATGEEATIKDIDLKNTDELERLRSEINRLATLSSPNLSPYLGTAPVPGAAARLRVAVAAAAASAADLIDPSRGQDPLSEPCVAFIIREVLNALVYLHSEGVPARRLAPAALLLSSEGEVRVGDFGCAALAWTGEGRHLYAAPEVAQRVLEAGDDGAAAAAAQGEAADVWALGITAIALAKGRPPRAGEAPDRALLAVAREPPPALEGGDASPGFKDFVWQCLRKAPRDRPAAIDLLMHPWVLSAELPPELLARVAAVARGRRLRAGAPLREDEHDQEGADERLDVESEEEEEALGGGGEAQLSAAAAPQPDVYGTTVVHPQPDVHRLDDSLASLSFGYMTRGAAERDPAAAAAAAAAASLDPTDSVNFGTTVIRRVLPPPSPPPAGTGTVVGPGPFGGGEFLGAGGTTTPPPPPRAPRPPRHSQHAPARPREAVAAALEGMAAELGDPGIPSIAELQAVLGARAAELRAGGGGATVDMGCLGNYLVSQWSS